MMFRKRNQAENRIKWIGKLLDYAKKYLRDKSDEELLEIREQYRTSKFRMTCIGLRVPILGERYRFEQEEVDFEINARDVVRRYEDGEAVCGISGF